MANLADLMKKHAKAFKEAEAPDRTPLPDGSYQVEVSKYPGKSIIVQDKGDMAWRARLCLTVVSAGDEALKGRKASKSWTLFNGDETPNDKGFGYLKQDLQAAGLDAKDMDLTQIGEAFEELVGRILDVTVRNTTDNQGTPRNNIYFNGYAGDAKPKGNAPKAAGKPGRKF